MNPSTQTALTIAAVCISLFSATVAASSLGWNIYRDIILKPKLKIKFEVRDLFIADGVARAPNSKVTISATNFGPNEIKCTGIYTVKYKRGLLRLLKRVKTWGFVVFDFTEPISGKLPRKLEVGETIDLFFPFVDDCLLKDNFDRIGISDSFGRNHWASKKDIKAARTLYNKKFVSGDRSAIKSSEVHPVNNG